MILIMITWLSDCFDTARTDLNLALGGWGVFSRRVNKVPGIGREL